MRDVYIIGAHTIKFCKYLDKSIKDLTAMTVNPCLREANLDKKDIQALWFANSGWGYARGQECIKAQVALRPMGIEAIPMTNVENACAGGSTAFNVITQKDGRNMWRMKRMTPELYFKVFGLLYRTGLYDRHLTKLLKVLNAVG